MLQGIDASLFPVLKTRKALLVVDAQNDFLSADGALRTDIPHDLTGRIVRLVKGFRPYGDVVWIRSEYSQPRPPRNEQIITSDAPVASSGRQSRPRGRKQASGSIDQPASRCPEAFLSGPAPGRPECVREDTNGAQFPPKIQELVEKKDMSFVKTYYSGFQIPDLIQRLRMKFVSEVFICGSWSNISIMATAIDAGSHGLDIGIIEDCCSYRDKERHSEALRRIQEMTGCEILSTDHILDRLKPKPKVQRMAAPIPNPTGRRYPSVYENTPGSTVGADGSKDPVPEASPMGSESSARRLSLYGDTDSNLPPITFTRARVAARGRPSRPLPDLAKQFGEQFDIKGSMNASPNDDLNQNSGDESQNEGPLKAAAAQPQTSAQARRQKNSSEMPQGIEAALRAFSLNTEEEGASARTSQSSRQYPGPPTKEATTIKAEMFAASMTALKTAPKAMRETENHTLNDLATGLENMSMHESEPLCEGDTKVLYDVLPKPLSEDIFEKIRSEVNWQRMSHQGGEVPRLVAVQGEVEEDGSIPVYRHPADESPPLHPWTSVVKEIKSIVEKKVGHTLNHALIQFYRDGSDYISEHSDKTLDIAKGSFIVNVSLGAERTMVLRTKRSPKQTDDLKPAPAADGPRREIQRARLPHNSMCKMGLQTNMRWLHAIRQDKRLDRDKTTEELAYNGARISLTFRQIGTFLDRDQQLIWGQGAKSKTKTDAHKVINGQTPEAIAMLKAFGRENQSSEFDWEEYYGQGFDVLHISAALRLFTSSDPVANMRVQFMLGELAVGHAKGSSAPVSTDRDALRDHRPKDIPIKLVDNDPSKSTVTGDVAIMMYLDRYYGKTNADTTTRANVARTLTRFQEALGLGALRLTLEHPTLKSFLDSWEVYAGEADFIGGSSIGMADFAFWPVLYDILEGSWKLQAYPNLKAYFERIRNRDSIVKVYGKDKEAQAQETTKKLTQGLNQFGQAALRQFMAKRDATLDGQSTEVAGLEPVGKAAEASLQGANNTDE